MCSIDDDWPLRDFGYWKEYGESYEQFPSIYDFINPEINRTYEKEKLLHYLRNAPPFVYTSRISIRRIFDDEEENGALYGRTDGEWTWMDSICDMIEYHDLVIPRAFYKEIQEREFRIPQFTEEEMNAIVDKIMKFGHL